jgi:hypothetical protein
MLDGRSGSNDMLLVMRVKSVVHVRSSMIDKIHGCPCIKCQVSVETADKKQCSRPHSPTGPVHLALTAPAQTQQNSCSRMLGVALCRDEGWGFGGASHVTAYVVFCSTFVSYMQAVFSLMSYSPSQTLCVLCPVIRFVYVSFFARG